MVAPWSDNASRWFDLECRVSTGLRLDGGELKLEGILNFVEGEVLDDVKVEVVAVRSTSWLRTLVILVEYLPVDLNTLDARVLNVESFAYWLTLGDNSWDRQGRRNGIVIQADLIWRNTNWTTTDRDTHWEFNIGKTLNLCYDPIIELTAYVIVNCNRHGNLGIWWQISHEGVEDDGETLVVAEVEALLLLELLCFGECLADSGAELLGLFMFITQNGSGPHCNLVATSRL